MLNKKDGYGKILEFYSKNEQDLTRVRFARF